MGEGSPNLRIELRFIDENGIVRDVKGDGDSGDGDNLGIYILNKVYNPLTLHWDRMKQPTLQVGDLTVTMGDVEKLLAGDYWHDDISTYVDGNLIYRALNTTHKAATSATTWYIWKYTWTNGERTRREGPLVGSVDGQSDLAWAE